MRRIIGLTTAFCLAIALSAVPAKAAMTVVEPSAVAATAPEASDINLVVSGKSLRVTGAAKRTLTVYNLTGTKAASYQVETEDQTITTNLDKGIYIVKAGKFVRKVSISER